MTWTDRFAYLHTPTGRLVRIVGTPDSDPNTEIWCCYLDDPDTAVFAARADLTLTDESL